MNFDYMLNAAMLLFINNKPVQLPGVVSLYPVSHIHL